MQSTKPDLWSAVDKVVFKLQSDLLSNDHRRSTSARALLSHLRQGADKEPSKDPMAWHAALEQLVPELPAERLGHQDQPTRTELAAYQALTLFALHQQSKATPMHRRGESMAFALGRLAAVSGSSSIKPRFDALILAPRPMQRSYHLRSLVTLLRSWELPCDYGQLSQDLFQLSDPARKNGVILRWSRQFEIGFFISSNPATEASTN